MTPPAAAVAEPLPRRRTSTRRAPVRHPRRISGPARPATRPPARPAGRPAAPARGAQRRGRTESGGLALRAVRAYERVADSALLDRLVRGRLWIGLLAFGLIGIVAMQLVVLRLNTSIGAALQRAAGLQRASAQLRIEAATGSGEGRIEPLAAATGMTFAPPGSVHFVSSSPAADIARAAGVLSQPIQPRESAPAAPETTSAGGTGGESEASGAASPSAGEAGTTSEITAPSGESSPTSSGEASAPVASHSAEATTAGTSEPEASAATAGGVAAGH
jgi:hypothetical protein